MKFINPYDLAFNIKFNNLGKKNIKKFKKILFSELDLFDEEINIKNKTFTKNECYETINEIEKNKDLLSIYSAIYSKNELNNFLYDIYNKNFLKKITLYLSQKKCPIREFIAKHSKHIFSKAYKQAYLENDKNILSLNLELDLEYMEFIYSPVYKILKNEENELFNLKINSSYGFYDIEKIIDIEKINSLPDYFNKIRTSIAYTIRDLSIDRWNNKNNITLALKIIDFSLKIKTSKKENDEFLSTKKDLKKINNNIKSKKIIKSEEPEELGIISIIIIVIIKLFPILLFKIIFLLIRFIRLQVSRGYKGG